jgi:uncharacterized protein (DUF433 family)
MRGARPTRKSQDDQRNGAEALIRRYIERREGVVGGEPVIVDTRISVRDIVLYWRAYGNVERIVRALRISPEAIQAALGYYELNRDEIEQYIREDEEAGEAIDRENDQARRAGP